MTAIFEGIGDFFTWSFQIMPPLGNAPNLIFIAVITALLAYWVYQLGIAREKHQRDPSYLE
ncbi:MAG: hypothetical protein V6Z82_02030 [Flavobacteriales bacterium]